MRLVDPDLVLPVGQLAGALERLVEEAAA